MPTRTEIEATVEAMVSFDAEINRHPGPLADDYYYQLANVALKAAEKVRHSYELPEPSRSSHYS